MGRLVSPFKTYCLLLNKALVCEGEKLVFLPCSEVCKPQHLFSEFCCQPPP